MVKPPLRTKSIGFKVSEEEYARLETAARTSGRTLGEWCREVVLASASDAERRDPALAEIVGVRLLLVNVLGPLAAGEKVTPERFNQLLEQISETKHQLAAKLQQQASEKPQREKPSGGKKGFSHFFAGERTERGRPVKALRFAPTADAARTKRAALTRLPLRSCRASS